MNTVQTHTGEVKRIIKDRGFGFIRRDGDHKELFFHVSELVNIHFDDLKEGDRVAFLIGERKEKQCCFDVVVEKAEGEG